jgi:GTPase SAR1 family protein
VINDDMPVYPRFLAIGIIIALVLSLIIVIQKVMESPVTGFIQPYNVAIIGFPKSGKTTLIVSLFKEIMNQRMSGVKATLKGSSTIERINDLLAKMESGIPIGPTNDQTMFAYRTNLETTNTLFKNEYRVEFGDYPGEYTEGLSQEKYFANFKKTEFFKWCVEAQAYIFVVDVGSYLLDENRRKFIAESTKIIRESWQHFLDNSPVSEKEKHNKPVLLVFNKMDLFSLIQAYTSNVEHEELNPIEAKQIKDRGFSTDKLPQVVELDSFNYYAQKKKLTSDFENLISYLKSDCTQFKIIFPSSFGRVENKLPDIADILKCIMPKKIKY